MSRAIKFKDNDYLDSSSVNYNRKDLTTFLNDIANNMFMLNEKLDVLNDKLSNMFTTITSSSVVVAGLNANNYGYKDFTLTIPPNYTAYFIGFTGNGRVADLNGLQITNVFQPLFVNDTDSEMTVTGYLTFYAPQSITRANTRINAMYLLIKNTLVQ